MERYSKDNSQDGSDDGVCRSKNQLDYWQNDLGSISMLNRGRSAGSFPEQKLVIETKTDFDFIQSFPHISTFSFHVALSLLNLCNIYMRGGGWTPPLAQY